MTEHLHRHDVWGDDPAEIEASIVVSELEAEQDPRWHDHPAFVPLKAVARFIRRSGKRIVVTVVGFLVLMIGIAGLVLPLLPGWALIFVGLGILATEYVWARRLLLKAKRVARAAADKALRRNGDRTAKGTDDRVEVDAG